MTFSQFVHSLQQIGVKLPKDKTKVCTFVIPSMILNLENV